ncbi:hypothetical protein QJS10_CPA03g01692 [Acorus calamus]|uniref:Uncharacterized protein n=1 Tax=Acorus calamus TaxID=4465 RepID=A0AAV9F870_ACOCL|nr:hypothetical protein QJS10_CPA03g01692 [Acorus calamus]
MVVAPKSWLTDLFRSNGGDHSVLGILSFEAARSMSRLVSLHRSLSDSDFSALRDRTVHSAGVAFLNSSDPSHLLTLACAENLSALDSAADVVSRLSHRCRSRDLRGFSAVYSDLKTGAVDLGRVAFLPRVLDRKVRRMEELASMTSALYGRMEDLAEMEAAERRNGQWKSFSGPIKAAAPQSPPESEDFRRKIEKQRQIVRKLKEASLWGKTVDKAVKLMACAICSIFARICVLFGPYDPDLPLTLTDRTGNIRLFRIHHHQLIYASGPLERPAAAANLIIRNSGPILRTAPKKSQPILTPAASTVGGAALAVRYAEVIVAAESLLHCGAADDEAREELYAMLPAGLRGAVKGKLRRCWREGESGPSDDESMAEGWREAVGRLMEWLGPVAHDTLAWQAERSLERQNREETGRRRVMMMQTLYFSDREKVEAAIAEVLVGLSCVRWYESRREEEKM